MKTGPSLILLASFIALFILVGCVQEAGQAAPAATATPMTGQATKITALPTSTPAATALPAAKTVEITASGFEPQELRIKAGETVVFVNKDSKPHRPASNPHPIHTDYPETGGCVGSKFDACNALEPGEKFEFTFNEKGEWGYHDHLNPGTTGKIVVE